MFCFVFKAEIEPSGALYMLDVMIDLDFLFDWALSSTWRQTTGDVSNEVSELGKLR